LSSEEWFRFFEKVFDQVKRVLTAHYRLEEDGSGPPDIVALRKAVDALPFAIKIIELQVDTQKHSWVKDRSCPLMEYDFSRLGKVVVDYYGSIDVEDKETLRETLLKNFDMEVDEFFGPFYPDLRTLGIWDPEKHPDSYIAFAPYDIRQDPQEFVFHLATTFTLTIGEMIARRFKVEVDYAAKYNLKPDPIKPIEELLQRDIDHPRKSIEDIQKDVSTIQLVPEAPEAVQRIFRNAKDLYIFGYFRYKFFTIAEHYARLALESAIKNRYYQSLGKEVVLRNNKGAEVRMGEPTHQRIIDFCRENKGWHPSNVLVNGQKFAYTNKELLNWLVKERIITLWEKRLCEHGLRIRDLLSHQTFAPIQMPNYAHSALVETANLIDRLFATK